MIVFCTHCWTETNSSLSRCPKCGADLALDQRSYEEKLVGALDHPLPEARVRTCWLLGTNRIQVASEKLMEMAQEDPDLFVRHAAVQALGYLRAPDIVPFLEELAKQDDRWMVREIRDSLERLKVEANASAGDRY